MSADRNPSAFVLYAKTSWSPYRDTFEDGPVFIAAVLPGGFSGFGADADAACRMAVSRARMSWKAAKGKGFNPRTWWDSIANRTTPSLAALIDGLDLDEDELDTGIPSDHTTVFAKKGRSDNLPERLHELVGACGAP